MNKRVKETVQVDSVLRTEAIAAAAANPAVTPLVPLGEKHRKALFNVTIISDNDDIDNSATFQIGIVDDTVALPALTGELAALALAGDTIKYQDVAVGDLIAGGVHSMQLDVGGATDAQPDTVTLNGVVFTCAGVPATAFEWDDRDDLLAAVNAANIGITATAGGAGEIILNASEVGGTITYATNAIARIANADTLLLQFSFEMEADASEMATGATGVYAVVDFPAGTGTDLEVFCDCVRGGSRYAPEGSAAISL